MFSSYKIEGIVIKRSNFSEADKILTIFSQNYGKIKALAKGVRKIKSRRAPHIELFNYAKINLYRGKNFDILTEAEVINTFSNLKKDLKKVTTAYYLAELIDNLCPERQEHNEILREFINSLVILNDSNFVDVQALTDKFSLFTLSNLGFIIKGKVYPGQEIKYFIEDLIEKKLKTAELLGRLH